MPAKVLLYDKPKIIGKGVCDYCGTECYVKRFSSGVVVSTCSRYCSERLKIEKIIGADYSEKK